jgi:uroporphyrinogen-III synthase
MPKVDLPLDQRNIIITRSKEGILDIKKNIHKQGR